MTAPRSKVHGLVDGGYRLDVAALVDPSAAHESPLTHGRLCRVETTGKLLDGSPR
jgi:hypothetical protein